MAENIASLLEAQLKKATEYVNSWARRAGINWMVWDQDELDHAGIDRVELADWVSMAVATKKVPGIVPQFLMEAGASPEIEECPINSALVCIHEERMILEVPRIEIRKGEAK